MLCVLFTPLAALFLGSDVPAAQEPCVSVYCHLVWPGWISPGCCGPVARLVTVTWWHAALQLQPSSYNFKLMIGKLEVGDWPLSPRGQGWVLYVHMGCMQNFWRPRGETLAQADLPVYDCHCLPVALIWVKSLSQRIGPSHSQRRWDLRFNSWEQVLKNEFLPLKYWSPQKRFNWALEEPFFFTRTAVQFEMCKFSLCLIHQVNFLPAQAAPWSSKFYFWSSKFLKLPEVLKWNGEISCDSNHQTFQLIYVSFHHIHVSCFHLASDFPVTEHAM